MKMVNIKNIKQEYDNIFRKKCCSGNENFAI